MSDSSAPPPPRIGVSIPGDPGSQDRLDVSLDSAPDLADLASLFSDLLVAGMAAHHLNAPEIQGVEFVYLRRACWEGAIIAYGRCFGGGQGLRGRTRLRLDGFLDHLPEDLYQAHHKIILMRNKRIGHHVAPHGGQEVTFSAGIHQSGPTHLELTNLFVHVETELYDGQLLEQLLSITTLLREKVGERIDELRTDLLKRSTTDLPGLLDALRSGTAWEIDGA